MRRRKLKPRAPTGNLTDSPSINTFRALCTSITIFFDFFLGLLRVRQYKKAISFFGSAREILDPRYYRDAEDLAAALSKRGFDIITGGNGGIMRSANKGAYQQGGNSIGVTVPIIADGQESLDGNRFISKKIQTAFFFSRKTLLSCSSELYIFFPGGFGTLDELFEMLTLIQTSNSEKVPILLYGKDFWGPLVKVLREHIIAKYKTVDQEEIESFPIRVVDSVDDALFYIDNLNLKNSRMCKLGLYIK